MRRVLIESPYSSGTVPSISRGVARNVRYLRACLRDCVLRGETPYASHGLLTQEGVLRDEVPEERALGIEAGFVMRRAMDATVIYTDLGWSGGCWPARRMLRSSPGDSSTTGSTATSPRSASSARYRPDMKWHMRGQWGHILVDVEPLPFVPCKGALYLFDLPDNLHDHGSTKPMVEDPLS